MNNIKNKEYKDPIYKDYTISKLVNVLMKKGKKSIIEKIIYKTLALIKIKHKQNPLIYLKKAVNNIKPSVELKTVRLSGTRYQVPFELNTSKQENIAIRWLVEGVGTRTEKNLISKLFMEITNAYNNKGYSFKKKEETHKKAEANRTFIHYRW